MPIYMDNKMLSIGQTASYLGVSIDTLRRWDNAGKIKSIRLDGKNRFFERSEVERVKKGEENLKVSDAAKELGISASTLRRYGEKGIIVPERLGNGERVYKKEILERLTGKDNKLNYAINGLLSSYGKTNNQQVKYSFNKKYGTQVIKNNPKLSSGTGNRFSWAVIIILIVLLFTTSLSTMYLYGLSVSGRAGRGKIVENSAGKSEGEITEEISLDADFLRGKFPGIDEGNIVYFAPEGEITGLMIYNKNISDGSVSSEKVALDAITSTKILDATITTADLANDAVTGIKILNDSIKTRHCSKRDQLGKN